MCKTIGFQASEYLAIRVAGQLVMGGGAQSDIKQLCAAALRHVPIIYVLHYIIDVHASKWPPFILYNVSDQELDGDKSHHFCTLYVSYQNWMVVKAYNLTS